MKKQIGQALTIREKTKDAKRIVVVEMNLGQYVHEICPGVDRKTQVVAG